MKNLMKASLALVVMGLFACGAEQNNSETNGITTRPSRPINVDAKSTVAENDAACKGQLGSEWSYARGSEVILTSGGTGALTSFTAADGKVVIIKDPKRVELKQIKCAK